MRSWVTEDCVKEGHKGLDSGVMRGGVKSRAVRAVHKVSVARADKGVAQGLGDGCAGGAVDDIAFPLCGR